MIARVRIAPVERWCEGIKTMTAGYGPIPDDYAGKMTEIHPESMGKSDWCEGKSWRIKQEIVRVNRTKYCNGVEAESPGYICEHMLELD